MNKQHKYADVIKHWADGGEIQKKCIDVTTNRLVWIKDHWPNFNDPTQEWRIKPKVLRYRVALFRLSDGNYYTETVNTEGEADNTEDEDNNFVKWLADWQEVEI